MEEAERRKVYLVPRVNNSIAHTVYNVLRDHYDVEGVDIPPEDGVPIIRCSDVVSPYDKKFTEELFWNKGFYPRPIMKRKCIKKPVRGSSSEGISTTIYAGDHDEGFIFQDFIDGTEFTVDCWTRKGRVMNHAARERRDVWHGITMNSLFRPDIARRVKPLLGDIAMMVGGDHLLTTQFIEDHNGKIWLTEINYRPCANMCYGGDSNFILNFVRSHFGEDINTDEIKTKELRRYLGWVEI